MKLTPVNDNLVVEIPNLDIEKRTESGLIISCKNVGQSKPDQGKVIAIGDGRIAANGELVKMNVKVGDNIIFNRFAGTEIEANNKKYLIIKECDILAKIS